MPKKRILLIEDDEDIRRNLQDLLESEGYDVDQASDGQVALKQLKTSSNLPGLILLDLMMPNMNGAQFREAQEGDPRLCGIPVILMTADGQIESKRFKVGAKDSIRKPVDLDELLAKIHRFSA